MVYLSGKQATMRGKLAAVLRDLNDAAEAKHGYPQRASLKGGLHIGVLVNSGHTYLQIWRTNGTSPSDSEWHIVLRDFPYQLPVITPTRKLYKGKHCLMGQWPTPVPLPFEAQITEMGN